LLVNKPILNDFNKRKIFVLGNLLPNTYNVAFKVGHKLPALSLEVLIKSLSELWEAFRCVNGHKHSNHWLVTLE
jgi:hypothetical protein